MYARFNAHGPHTCNMRCTCARPATCNVHPTTWHSPRTTLRRRPARSVQPTDDELQQTDGALQHALPRAAAPRAGPCHASVHERSDAFESVPVAHISTRMHTHTRARARTQTHTHAHAHIRSPRAERWWRLLSGRLGDSSAVTTKYQERWLRCACCRPHRPTPTSGRHVHPPAVSAVCARLCRASPLQATVYGAPTMHVANVARCQHCKRRKRRALQTLRVANVAAVARCNRSVLHPALVGRARSPMSSACARC